MRCQYIAVALAWTPRSPFVLPINCKLTRLSEYLREPFETDHAVLAELVSILNIPGDVSPFLNEVSLQSCSVWGVRLSCTSKRRVWMGGKKKEKENGKRIAASQVVRRLL